MSNQQQHVPSGAGAPHRDNRNVSSDQAGPSAPQTHPDTRHIENRNASQVQAAPNNVPQISHNRQMENRNASQVQAAPNNVPQISPNTRQRDSGNGSIVQVDHPSVANRRRNNGNTSLVQAVPVVPQTTLDNGQANNRFFTVAEMLLRIDESVRLLTAEVGGVKHKLQRLERGFENLYEETQALRDDGQELREKTDELRDVTQILSGVVEDFGDQAERLEGEIAGLSEGAADIRQDLHQVFAGGPRMVSNPPPATVHVIVGSNNPGFVPGPEPVQQYYYPQQ